MKQIIEEAAMQELNSIVDGELAYQRQAMLNMFNKGAQWQSHQSPWISVNEGLPKPKQEVLLYDSSSIRHYVVGWLRENKGYNKSKWCVTNGYVTDEGITHWMPIVEPK